MAEQRPRWCPKCWALRGWRKVRLPGARASYRACEQCDTRTQRRIPRAAGGRKPRKTRTIKLIVLDALAREICRARGRCEATGHDGVTCSRDLQWAHIVGRSYHKVRWDEDNCFLLCSAHHIFYTDRHLHWERFVVLKIGAAHYDELKRRALAPGKVDREAIHRVLGARVREVEQWRKSSGAVAAPLT